MEIGALARRGVIAAALVVAGVAGCSTSTLDLGYDCDPGERFAADCSLCPQNCAAADAGADAEAGLPGEVCDGQCVTAATAPFDGPVLFWTGPSPDPASEILVCPETAPLTGRWYADLQAPPIACGACSCDPPAGSCTLPATLTANSAVCPGTDSMAAHFSFDAPAGWTGACSAANAIDAGKTCDGLPCVESLFIAPLQVTHGGCMPVAEPSAKPPEPTWGTTSIVCQGIPSTGPGACGAAQLTCTPAAPPGFSTCVYQPGVVGCPLDSVPYTERHVIYKDKVDTRSCTPCSCGDPEGDACTASISVFKDDACSEPIPLNVPLDSTFSQCINVPPGTALGSKSATLPAYLPGACQPSGGEPAGAVYAEPATALTLCCIPAPP